MLAQHALGFRGLDDVRFLPFSRISLVELRHVKLDLPCSLLLYLNAAVIPGRCLSIPLDQLTDHVYGPENEIPAASQAQRKNTRRQHIHRVRQALGLIHTSTSWEICNPFDRDGTRDKIFIRRASHEEIRRWEQQVEPTR